MWEYYQKRTKKKNRVRYTNLEIERRIRYKEEAVRLLGGCCSECRGVFPTPVYDFHHLDPTTKEHSPAKLFSYSWDRVVAEVINKCVLLCANCHRIKHFVEEKYNHTTISKEQGPELPASSP